MLMRSFTFLSALLLPVLASAADIDSGPALDSAVPALTVQAVAGLEAGKKLDFAAARKDKPTVFVFIQSENFGRPVARYLKVLDTAMAGKDVAIVAVWLTDDAEKTREYLPKVQMSLKLETTALSYDPDNKTGPNAWVLHEKAFVTTIVSDGKKVRARFGHQSINDTMVPEVEAAVKKLTEKK